MFPRNKLRKQYLAVQDTNRQVVHNFMVSKPKQIHISRAVIDTGNDFEFESYVIAYTIVGECEELYGVNITDMLNQRYVDFESDLPCKVVRQVFLPEGMTPITMVYQERKTSIGGK